MNEIQYIVSGLIAWLSLLYVVLTLVRAKHGKLADKSLVQKAVADANRAKEKASEMSEEMYIDIEKLKQRHTLFEESLNSFTNRLSARKPRKKKDEEEEPELTPEQLAELLQQQTQELNGGQQELDLPDQNPNRKPRLVPLK